MHRAQIFLFRHARLRILIQSASIALVSYFSALIGANVENAVAEGRWQSIGLDLVIVVVLTTIIVFLIRLFRVHSDLQFQSRANVLATAHSQIDACLASELARLETIRSSTTPTLRAVAEPMTNIQNYVKALYASVDAHYSLGDVPGERVNFEVTFMSLDYDDSKVTILAWASRDGRMPKSLAQRSQRPDIYDSTITADLYRETRNQLPQVRIISDTSQTLDYAELYPGQKTRIKSTIVVPVLSSTNELLGTLVMHCDQIGFFRQQEQRFWVQLIDAFSLRIAIDKLRLDILKNNSGIP